MVNVDTKSIINKELNRGHMVNVDTRSIIKDVGRCCMVNVDTEYNS